MLERTEDERRGTDEKNGTTSTWRRKWIMANTAKYNLLPTAYKAQNKDEPLTSFVHPKGDSLHSRKPNRHDRTNHNAQKNRKTNHRHKKAPLRKTPHRRPQHKLECWERCRNGQNRREAKNHLLKAKSSLPGPKTRVFQNSINCPKCKRSFTII